MWKILKKKKNEMSQRFITATMIVAGSLGNSNVDRDLSNEHLVRNAYKLADEIIRQDGIKK